MEWTVETSTRFRGLYNVLDQHGNPIAEDVTRENAFLIAAAPTMYKSLERAHQTIRNIGIGFAIGDTRQIALNEAENIKHDLWFARGE